MSNIRSMKKISFLLLSLMFTTVVVASESNGDCKLFHNALKSIPNTKLVLKHGKYISLMSSWEKKEYSGCEVVFQSNNKLLAGIKTIPYFSALKGSDLYKKGWRMDYRYATDGLDGDSRGIRKGQALCIVHTEHDAYVDEKTGKIVPAEKLKITVQCRRDAN